MSLTPALLLLVTLLGSFWLQHVHAEPFSAGTLVPPQAFAACALAKPDAIFCYGGSTTRQGDLGDDVFSDSTQISKLDLTSFTFDTIPSLYWTTNNYMYRNAENVVVPVVNGSQLFLYGGYDTLQYAGFLVIPSDTGFQTIASITPPNYTVNYTGNATYFRYETAAVPLPNNQVWIFGGLATHTSAFKLATNSVVYFSLTSNQFTSINTTTPGGATRYGHTANLASNGTVIYVVGGFTAQPNTVSTQVDATSSLQDVWTFDTTTSQWNAVLAQSNASTPIIGRMYHTATNLSQPQFFINDTAYIYDLAQNQMFPVNITNPSAGPTHLFSHAAVAYEKQNCTYIFVLFGQGDGGNPLSITYILNATDTKSMQWLGHENAAASGNNGGNGSSGASATTNGLTSGAIAGISVGVAVAGIGIGSALIAYYFKKKKKKQDFRIELSDPRNADAMRLTTAFHQDFHQEPQNFHQYAHTEYTESTTQSPGSYDTAVNPFQSVKPDGVIHTKPFAKE
ncbi:hypothetical protein BC940DRAFT_319302 [Gongronella butleri]|nr:hypothetical protein BC940DRAFT_319302 [Gongronella butleri]